MTLAPADQPGKVVRTVSVRPAEIGKALSMPLNGLAAGAYRLTATRPGEAQPSKAREFAVSIVPWPGQ